MERLSRIVSPSNAWSAAGRAVALRLVLATALLWPQLAQAMIAPDRQGCFIRLSREGQVLHLSAYVESGQPLQGSYRLSVVKRGPAGQSRSLQNGAFRAPAPDGEALLLGRISVRLTGADNVSADLTVRVENRIICHAVL